MTPTSYADAVHRAFPMVLALAVLSALVAIVTDSVTTFHAVAVILTSFGVCWYYQYDAKRTTR